MYVKVVLSRATHLTPTLSPLKGGEGVGCRRTPPAGETVMSTDRPSPKTLAEIAASRPQADLARIDATTEDEIAGFERDDDAAGFDWTGATPVLHPSAPIPARCGGSSA